MLYHPQALLFMVGFILFERVTLS